MFFGYWDVHDAIDELYSNQRQERWDRISLMQVLRSALVNFEIINIDIEECPTERKTIIKIVLNHNNCVMQKMVDDNFNPDKSIKEIIQHNFTMLKPEVKITYE